MADTGLHHILCICNKTHCPAYKRCCKLPTEYYKSPEGMVHILFVGMGGGRDERRRKRPFIGVSGRRLREITQYIRREVLKKHIGVAFSNTIRDNPEANREPTPEELEHCLPFLYKDIELLRNVGLKVVVPLGVHTQEVLVPGFSRGRIQRPREGPMKDMVVAPTFHPSYLVRMGHLRFNMAQPSMRDLMVVKDIVNAYYAAWPIR